MELRKSRWITHELTLQLAGKPACILAKARREPDAPAAPEEQNRIHKKAHAGVGTGTPKPAPGL
jgi:hypothetical protein